MLKLMSIQAEGFKNLKIPRLEFPPEGNILIVGRNESGKSSLFEAVFFALTGSLLVKKGKSFLDALAFKKNKATVSLEFQKRGTRAIIDRTIVRRGQKNTAMEVSFKVFPEGKSELVFNDRNNSRTDVDDKIKEFLGFDGDILKNSCFVQQKELDGFIETPRQDKIKIINKLLNLENFSKLKKKYDDYTKSFQPVAKFFENAYRADKLAVEEEKIGKAIAVLDDAFKQVIKVDQLKAKLENFDSKTIKASIASLDAERKTRLVERAGLESQRAKLDDLEKKIIAWQRNAETSRVVMAKHKQWKTEREVAETKLKGILDDISRLDMSSQEFVVSKVRLDDANKKLREYQSWESSIKKYKSLEKDHHAAKISIDRLKTQLEEKEHQFIAHEIAINERVIATTRHFKESASQFTRDTEEKHDLELQRDMAEQSLRIARERQDITKEAALLAQKRETEEKKLAGFKAKI
nr:hypothetical protein [Candidatus Sigynarchaeota archaeon]